MDRQQNVGRQFAVIFVVAGVLGAGFVAYMLWTTAPLREAARAAATAGPVTAPFATGPSRGDEARRVAATFVQRLSASAYDEAYAQMAAPYRQTTSLESFRASCLASPFLAGARSVSLSKTREEFAPGEKSGSLSATGVLSTTAGNVDVTFWFITDAANTAVLGMSIAGVPALPMGAASAPAKSAASPSKRSR